MFLYENPSTDPFYNLALEEYLFRTAGAHEKCLLLWRNDKTVVVGRNQNVAAEINASYVMENGIRIARRMTGGGTVYHDLGNLNYSVICDAGDDFMSSVLAFLTGLGLAPALSGRNDLTICGRKFSGCAELVRNGRLLHHGTFLFDSDLKAMEKALHVPAEKISSKGISSVAGRVTNIRPCLQKNMDFSTFYAMLLRWVEKEKRPRRLVLRPEEEKEIRRLKEEKYSAWQWIYGRSPDCRIQRKKYLEGCGTVEVCMDVNKGRIETLVFCGDFLGHQEVRELEDLLTGIIPDRVHILEKLGNIHLDQYIRGLEMKDLLDLVCCI